MLTDDKKRQYEMMLEDLKKRGLPPVTEEEFVTMDEKFNFFIDNFFVLRKIKVMKQRGEDPSMQDIMWSGGILQDYMKKFGASPLEMVRDYNLYEPVLIGMLQGNALEVIDQQLEKFESQRKTESVKEEKPRKAELPSNPVLPKGFKLNKG